MRRQHFWIILLGLILLTGIAQATTTTINATYSYNTYRYANGTFTEMRNGVGTNVVTGINNTFPDMGANTINPYFLYNYRPGYTFPTSSLPDDAVISSATITAYSIGGVVIDLGNPTLSWINFTPTSSGGFVAADYNKTDWIRYTDNISASLFSTANSSTVWTLTAAGLAAINKTGNTTMMVEKSWMIDNSSPTWANSKSVAVGVRGYGYSGGNFAPQLSITYTSAGADPTAAFSGTPTSGTSPLGVTFTDASINTPTAWAWYFWDNETISSIDQNPSQSFTSGSYSIRLNASNAGGYDWENKTEYIGVGGTNSGTYPDIYDAIPYRYSASQWSGLRNGVGTSITSTSNYMYSDVGTNNVTNNFQYEYRPGFTANTSTVGSGSTITGGTITAYASGMWNGLGNPTYDWVDFTPANKESYTAADFSATTFTRLTNTAPAVTEFSGGSTLTWTLNAAGLAAIQKSGLTSFMLLPNWTIDNQSPTWASVQGTDADIYGYRYSGGTLKPYLSLNYSSIGGSAPSPDFTSNKTLCVAPCAVQFTDLSTNSPTSWYWDFDVGTPSTVQNPVVVFGTAGEYTIDLTATNAGGSVTEIKFHYLTVTEGVAGFYANETVGKPPFIVQFVDMADNSPTSWYWEFGDSSTSTLQNPVHTYTARGNYTVNFRATGSNVVWYNHTDYISLGYAPTAHFMMNIASSSWPAGTVFLQDYGVTGDGTDETAEINAGVAYAVAHASPAIVFPANKVILFTSRINFPAGTVVYGNGSTIQRKSGTNLGTVSLLGVYGYLNGLKIDGYALEGGIADDECYNNPTVRLRSDNGVNLYDNAVFINNEVTGVRAYSVQVYTGSNVYIAGNYIHDGCQYGIATGGGDADSHNITVTNNTLYNLNQVGIKIRGTIGATISNNTVHMKQSATDFARGISIYSDDRRSQTITITNNTVYGDAKGSNGDAISSDNVDTVQRDLCTGITITNNTADYSGVGIDVHFNNGIIQNNVVSHDTTCINNAGSGNTVSGNTRTDCADAGGA